MIRSVSVVIPVFNSEQTLPVLIARLTDVLKGLNNDFEIILVNDGSWDGSWSEICSLSEKYPELVGINLMRNFSQHNALLCGIMAATNEVIVTLDDDLQNPPEFIPKLLKKLDEDEVDVVYGVPEKQQQAFWRNLSSRITKLVLQNGMGATNACHISPYRAFRTKLRRAFDDFGGPYVAIDVLLTWGTNRFATVHVGHERRKVGRSNYNLRRLISTALDLMTGFSGLPLRLASFIGFFFTLFGIGILTYVVGRYFIVGYSVPGFTFLASIIAIFSGAQMFSLGIIGEYLTRMHFRTMQKPPYVIREIVRNNSGD